MEKIRASEYTLDKYLNMDESILFIPYTQRPYTWSAANVKRLISDVTSMYLNKDNSVHMLNFITLYETDGEQYIYDGQQRTVTSILIIAYLLDYIERNIDESKESLESKEEFEKYIREKKERYIYKRYAFQTDDPTWKINFENQDANKAFRSIIDKKSIPKNLNADHIGRLELNYRVIQSELKNIIESNKLNLFNVKDMLDSILNDTILILMLTDSEDIANSMFESLNNTGQKIELYYVLKNMCVTMIGEDQTRTYWENIDANLQEINKSDFLHAVATIEQGKTRKNQSLQVLEDQGYLADKESTVSLLERLEELSFHYRNIINPKLIEEKNTKIKNEYIQVSQEVDVFGFKQHRPLLLSLFESKSDISDIIDVNRLCLNLIVRNIFFGEKRANTVEEFFAQLANDVEKLGVNEIKEKIIKKTDRDDEVRSAIEHRIFATSATQKALKYILTEIYNDESNQEVQINRDTSKVWLEHILPQKPAADSVWSKVLRKSEDKEKTIYGLGNCTLLLDKLNVDAKNSDFDIKKKIYLKSNIAHNEKIIENTEWTLKEIDERTKDLTDKILKIW